MLIGHGEAGGKGGGEYARMVMRQTDEIYPGQVMELDRWVRSPGPRHPGPQMHMVARVQEILPRQSSSINQPASQPSAFAGFE